MIASRSPKQAFSASHTLGRRLVACAAASVLFAILWPASRFAGAEPARSDAFIIVVNSGNPLSSVSRDFLADAFLKKVSRWDDGEEIRPVDLRPDSVVRRAFSGSVLRRPVAAVRNYWQQRIFSGRDVPPPELDSDEAVIQFVARNRGGVGYVSAGAKVADVKVVAVR